MESKNKSSIRSSSELDPSELDLSSLVGRDIRIFPEQAPHQRMIRRAVMVHGGEITIDNSRSMSESKELTNDESVVIQFEYRGQQVSVKATIKNNPGGKYRLCLAEHAIPLVRRRFRRFDVSVPTRLAVFSTTRFDPKKMARLRWIETYTENVSCGGMMLDFNNLLKEETSLFVNATLEEFGVPRLVIAGVRHCHQDANGRFKIGLELMINEDKEQHFSPSIVRALPSSVLTYTAKMRSNVNEKLAAWMREQEEIQATGVHNE